MNLYNHSRNRFNLNKTFILLKKKKKKKKKRKHIIVSYVLLFMV